MAGIKRSTRLAKLHSRPKYNEFGSEEEEDSSKDKESEENEESDISEGEASDVVLASEPKSPLPPAETRAVTRKGRLDRNTQLLPVTSIKAPIRKSLKAKAKIKAKVKPMSPTFDLRERSDTSSSIHDDGSDHAEEDDYVSARRKETSQKSSKRSRPTSDASNSNDCEKSKSKGENIKIPPAEDNMSNSRNAMIQVKGDSTAKSSNDVDDVLGADLCERDEDHPLTSKNAVEDEGVKQGESGSDSTDGATQKYLKRSRPTSDASTSDDCKKSKGENIKIPPLEDNMSNSRNAMIKVNVDSTAKSSNDGDDVLGADLCERDEDHPLTSKNAVEDEGVKQGESGSDSTDGATQKYLEPKTATDTYENTPITVCRNDSNPHLKAESPPLTSMPGEIPTDKRFSDLSEKEARRKDVTVSNTLRCSEDVPNRSIRPIRDDSDGGGVVESGAKKSVDVTECDNGGSGQTSVDLSMQKDGHRIQHHNDAPIVYSSLSNAPTTSSEPTNDKKETLLSESMAAATMEANIEAAEVIVRSVIHESHAGAVDKAEPHQNKSGQSIPSPTENEQNDIQMNNDGSVMLESANSRIPKGEKNNPTGGPREVSRIMTDETTLHHYPSSHASKEMEGSPSLSPKEKRDLPKSNQMDVGITLSTSIQYPKSKQTRQPPSVGQLKMVLFLEASDAHRGNGAERMFANYWETFEKYITFGPHDANKRIRLDSSPILAGTDATLRGFLKTRKMKRLHNKLVLAIMREAMRTTMPELCSSHVPQQWQFATIKPISDDSKKEYQKTDLTQWNDTFGPCSGAWTVCGDSLALTEIEAGQAICPELVDNNRKGGLEEEEVLPSARLPGALEIEPLVRKHTEKLGLMASDNAIWMLVVAVREHSSSLIKKVVANDKDFRDGYAPSLPTDSRTSLACNHLTTKDLYGLNKQKTLQNFQAKKSSGKSIKRGTKVINSTSLSHVLVETPSVASRLTSIRSLVISDGRVVSSYGPALDNVNCIINASIQRGASIRQKSFTPNPNVSTKETTSPTLDLGPSKKSAKARPSTTQSLSTTLLPLKKPQLRAQARNQSIPTLIPPQYQSSLPSMPSQNVQPLNSTQRMNHSDHTKEIKPSRQQNLPFSRSEILNLEPLTKPGFPSFTNDSQKPKPSQSPALSTDTSPPRPVKRGAKNLATMMARPTSQSNLVKNANGATTEKATVSMQKDQNKKQEGGAKDKKNDTEETALPVTAPPRPKGRGFGVKNLSRMRARTSDKGS